jgi:uncharacterized protein (DUF924 family)
MPDNGRILIDDLEGAPASEPFLPGERADWLRRNHLTREEYPNENPHSPLYARDSIDETPGTILHFWFANAADRPERIADRMDVWFRGGFEMDRVIANRFSDILARLASGEALRWAARGPRERLAAIIALDQFSRSIFRDSAAQFENDELALKLAREAIARGEDAALAPIERWFLYMPLEHSENSSDQRRSVECFRRLLAEATPETRAHFETAYDFARRHARVISKFGEFPHRHAMLERETTPAEEAFLEKRPMGF